MAWSFVLTNQNFIPIGEIQNIQQRSVDIPLNKIDTCSFSVLGSNRHAPQLMTAQGYVKAYRNGVLSFYGPIISAEEVAEAGKVTISVNAASQAWVLGKRWVRNSVVTAASDRAVRFVDLLKLTEENTWVSSPYPWNPHSRAHSLIDQISASAASTAIYSITEPRNLNTVLGELSAGVDGFDWRFRPKENFIDNAVIIDDDPRGPTYDSTHIASFEAAPTLGSLKENAVFEYASGKHNLSSYRRVVTRETQADVVFHQASGQTPEFIESKNEESLGFWGWLEDSAQAELIDTGFRQSLTDDHVSIRRSPRQVIDFTPVSNYGRRRVPEFGTDFDVGDIVTARSGSFDALFRVWGVTFEINANGVERMTLALEEEG